MTEAHAISEFIKIVEKLGLVRRDIKLTDGSFQSDSSHILNLCFLTQMVAPFLKVPVDADKLLRLALVHDLVEAECGDIPLCAQKDNRALKLMKKQQEQAAIERYRDMLPPLLGKEIYDLFWDYENKTSREAKIVYVLDKLEANFSACRFGGGDIRYWAEGEGGDWYYYTVINGETAEKPWLSRLDEPILDQLETFAFHNCRQALIKSDIMVEDVLIDPTFKPAPILAAMIRFMEEIEPLSLIQRDNKLSDGTPETDADHIVKLCFLTLLATPYLKQKICPAKILKTALIHDLVEARSGDFSLAGQQSHPEWKFRKKAAEQQAIEYFRAILPDPVGQQFYDLFQEYEARQTPEARIVHALDKLEATLQGNLYNDGDVRYWGDCENGAWYYQMAVNPREVVSALNEPFVTALEQIIIDLSRDNIAKSHIDLCAE